MRISALTSACGLGFDLLLGDAHNYSMVRNFAPTLPQPSSLASDIDSYNSRYMAHIHPTPRDSSISKLLDFFRSTPACKTFQVFYEIIPNSNTKKTTSLLHW